MKLPEQRSVERPKLASIDELDQAICKLAVQINASHYRFLVLVREFDERGGWMQWGSLSCADWLHWRCDINCATAREKVRVAHALKALAEISAAFESGALSYSKVRALTRVAAPHNETHLLAFARQHSAALVEDRCRQLRNVQPASKIDARRAHAKRSLSMWKNADQNTMTITVELPIEEGQLVGQALDRAHAQLPQGPEFGDVSWHAQQADALLAMAKQYLTGGSEGPASTADQYQVVVHVDESALAGGEGRADLPLETLKRISCDGSTLTLVDNAQAEPLSVGRKKRSVPTAIKRALWSRDKGCSFPGCHHTRFVDAHHVQHWASGGDTSLANLMLLCSHHHRLVHESGYEVIKDDKGAWYFRRPDGRAIPRLGYRWSDMREEQDTEYEVREQHVSAET